MHGMAGRHQLQNAARTGAQTYAAAHALFCVHRRQTAFEHVNGPKGTGGLAVAKAQATVFAGFIAPGYLRGALAVLRPFVVKAQGAEFQAAAAAHGGDALFALTGLHAHDFGDGLRCGVPTYGAFVHRSVAGNHLLGVGVAARIAAAAAVRAGQAFAHLGLARILLDAEYAPDNRKQSSKDQAHAANHQGGGQDRFEIHSSSSTFRSGPQSQRRPPPSARRQSARPGNPASMRAGRSFPFFRGYRKIARSPA